MKNTNIFNNNKKSRTLSGKFKATVKELHRLKNKRINDSENLLVRCPLEIEFEDGSQASGEWIANLNYTNNCGPGEGYISIEFNENDWLIMDCKTMTTPNSYKNGVNSNGRLTVHNGHGRFANAHGEGVLMGHRSGTNLSENQSTNMEFRLNLHDD